jgi:hypothetical protein
MIDKKQLIEEEEATFRFIYGLHHDDWLKFCETERRDKGNQSRQSTAMLVRSLTQPNAWRFVISASELETLTFRMAKTLISAAEELADEAVNDKLAFARRLDDMKKMAEMLMEFGKEIQMREESEA